MLILALGLLLLGVTGWVLARRSCDGRVAEIVVAAWVYASAEVVLLTLALGELGVLRRGWMLAALALVLLAALLTGRRVPAPAITTRAITARAMDTARDPLLAGLGVVVLVALGYALALGVATPPNDVDSLVYHLPRAVLWLQQGHVGYIPGATDERLDAAPPNAEIGLLFTLLLADGDRWFALVQFLALLALGSVVFALARRIGLELRAATFSALAFVSLPLVLLQAGTALNDIVVASFLAATVLFALVPGRGVVVSGVALAVAAGVKPTTLVVLPALVVAAVALVPRARWLQVAGSWAIALGVGLYWYYVNVRETGSLDGGLAKLFEQVPDRAPAAIVLRFYQLTTDLLELPATAGRGRWLYALAGLCLAVGGLVVARRRERSQGLWLVAAGLFVAIVPIALFHLRFSFAHGARWTLDRLGQHALAATVDGPILRGYPNPMNGMFGLGAVILVVASVPLAIGAARRGMLVRGWGALAAAPLLVIAAFAVAFTFDEMRARFFIGPLALAATLWGLVLPRRALAYGTGVLLAASTVAALAFATWKPSGISLLFGESRSATGRTSVWSDPRWLVQGSSSALDAGANHYVEEAVPSTTPIGLVAGRDFGLYAFFDGTKRRVRLVPPGRVPPDVPWLVVTYDRTGDVPALRHRGWRVVLRTGGGWMVMRKAGAATTG